MKNLPKIIYLQVNPEKEHIEDFNELDEVTWCKDKVNDNDVAYFRKGEMRTVSIPNWEDESLLTEEDKNRIDDKLEELSKECTIEDYKEILEQHYEQVRELDIILNGIDSAAKQASLCDILSQLKDFKPTGLWMPIPQT